MASIDTFVAALRDHGCEPKRSRTGWACRCPAHDDRNPSLDISEGDDGRVLVHCHAGCTHKSICAAIGLTESDLFADDPNCPKERKLAARRRGDGDTTPRNAEDDSGFVAVTKEHADGQTFATADDAVAALERAKGTRSAEWTYTNATGEPVGNVIRWNTATGKDVRPVSRKADGTGWCIGGMPTPRPLFNLPDLIATPTGSRIYICEGEKAADAARAVGLVATTSPHGSKSASKADWSPVAGREVVILPDHDDAGEQYADDVVRLATAAGAKSVRIVRLVDLWEDTPKGGDIWDFAEHLHWDENTLRQRIESLVEATEPVTPDAPDTLTYRPFPVHLLPDPIRSFVADGARAIGCDASYVALPLLSALAGAIGTTTRIALKRGWTEPTNLWCAIVGESGTMKTPAFKLALKAIRKIQADAFKDHEVARAEWEVRQLRYESELTGWKRAAARGGGDDPPERPIAPIPRRYVVNDTTVEALAPILLNNPRGVLLARDELAGWLASFDRYSKSGKAGGDAAHWLSMHNGESLTIDRKTGTPPTIHVPSASVSIIGGIQPGTLRRALGPEHHESGMAARLLFAMPPRKAKRWTEADVDPEVESAVSVLFDRLFALEPDADSDGDDRPRLVHLTDEAKRAWVRFYNEHAREQVDLSGDEAAAFSKLEGYAARFALIVHLVRVAVDDPTIREPGLVDTASIAAGVGLARWFGHEARRVYAILNESDEGEASRQLIEWIERHEGTTTARDLTRGPREFRDRPDEAEKALGDLVSAGIGRWESSPPGPKGGRPVRRFRLLSWCDGSAGGDETPENSERGAGCVAVASDSK